MFDYIRMTLATPREANMNQKGCPECREAPEVRTEENRTVVILCPRHGHMAMGDDLEAATYHWNLYVSFISRAA